MHSRRRTSYSGASYCIAGIAYYRNSRSRCPCSATSSIDLLSPGFSIPSRFPFQIPRLFSSPLRFHRSLRCSTPIAPLSQSYAVRLQIVSRYLYTTHLSAAYCVHPPQDPSTRRSRLTCLCHPPHTHLPAEYCSIYASPCHHPHPARCPENAFAYLPSFRRHVWALSFVTQE